MPKLSDRLKKALWITTTGLLVSGLAYLYMKHFGTSADPFSAIHHPWQNHAIKIHIFIAAIFLFVFGMFVVDHLIPKIKHQVTTGKKSGWISFWTSITMCLSGYALQIFHQELVHTIFVWIHCLSGVLFFIALVLHAFFAKR